MKCILLVDDDITFARMIEAFLTKHGYKIEMASSVKAAKPIIDKAIHDLYLLDYRLPDGTGLDILQTKQQAGNRIPAVMMTSFDDVRTAVRAMQSGASNYITKPVHPDELLMIVQQHLDSASTETAQPAPHTYITGHSTAAEKLQDEIRLIAPTQMSVLIRGESGTGKEYVARSVHASSVRANAPFVAIDCGTLTHELASSALFGHVKGAFTGAVADKTGKMQQANGGTLFLDEIGNLGYEVQVKLLRAIQERIVQPLGSNREIPVDVRLIAATNDDLSAAVRQGKFREDLYYRINEFSVHVPPLRARQEDLPLFIAHFIAQANASLGRQVKDIAADAKSLFMDYTWPGNLRELKNVITRMVLLSTGELAEMSGIPDEMRDALQHPQPTHDTDLKARQEETEKMLIERTLREVRFNKSKAATLLNIDRSTLYAKMRKYGING